MKPNRPDELDDDLALLNMGLLFVGEQGKLIASYEGGNPYGNRRGFRGGLLLPEKKFRDFEQPPRTLHRCEAKDHYREWTQGCKTGKKTVCPIEFGAEMTEVALLGALSLARPTNDPVGRTGHAGHQQPAGQSVRRSAL